MRVDFLTVIQQGRLCSWTFSIKSPLPQIPLRSLLLLNSDRKKKKVHYIKSRNVIYLLYFLLQTPANIRLYQNNVRSRFGAQQLWNIKYLQGAQWTITLWLILLDGSFDPINELGDSGVDAGLHGVGASQAPWGHTLQDVPVLGVTHQRAAAVALQGEQTPRVLRSTAAETYRSTVQDVSLLKQLCAASHP